MDIVWNNMEGDSFIFCLINLDSKFGGVKRVILRKIFCEILQLESFPDLKEE